MWKRVGDLNTVVGTILAMVISYSLSWIAVVKFGWRYHDLVGVNSQPVDASNSIAAFAVMGSFLLSPILALAIRACAYAYLDERHTPAAR